jgi:LysR family glycine cleavage system transcriptional activator
MGARDLAGQSGIVFRDYNLAVQAAIAGQGVVLGSRPILHDLIGAGLLVNPFDVTLETSIGYDVVTTREALERPTVQRFVDWIASETLAPG